MATLRYAWGNFDGIRFRYLYERIEFYLLDKMQATWVS